MNVIVFPRHVRMAGLCMKGARDWAEIYGVDWPTFVKEGLALADMTQAMIEDPYMSRCIEAARREVQNG